MGSLDTSVAVIGGGVVGSAVLHALARRGVDATLLEAEHGLALRASGTNSGILHTGFDSTPGELETRLILRAVELRERLHEELGVAVWRCGALLQPRDDDQRAVVAALAANARANGVDVQLARDGALSIPGEAVTDPVAYCQALAGAAVSGGAQVRLGEHVRAVRSERDGLTVESDSGAVLRARAVVNCAGLYADEVAALAGEDTFSVYPRKGEFLVFEMPTHEPLEQILLPVPSALGKGVLVFPTIQRQLIAGPTALEREDKRDWSVEAGAPDRILERATRVFPALGDARRIGAYAGLRPAGRGSNYVIGPSRTTAHMVNVAAIRSTGLSASLAIGEYVAGLLEREGAVALASERTLAAPSPAAAEAVDAGGGWWERAARYDRLARAREQAL
jgi:glycerol-3-phosphate dehydrogenase